MKLRNPFKGFTKFEWFLWLGSLGAICAAHFAVLSDDYLSLATSLAGVTCLIFAARGDPVAPFINVAFSVMYTIISYMFGYYGEMLIYLCMQLPVTAASIFTWIKNSGKGGATVKTQKLTAKIFILMAVLTIAVTAAFFFVLKALGTRRLTISTLSVATSFSALFLMALRIPQYALAFILNDIVMIILWSMATTQDIGYISLTVCFTVFLANDAYTFVSWIKRAKKERLNAA